MATPMLVPTSVSSVSSSHMLYHQYLIMISVVIVMCCDVIILADSGSATHQSGTLLAEVAIEVLPV